jgi:PEP-CTERM motif
LRSSLASATSLLALLLLDGRGASAGTISMASPSISFGNVLVGPGVTASGSDLATATGVTATVDNFSFSASTLSSFTPGTIQTVTGLKTGSSGNFTYTGSTSATYHFSPAATGSVSATVTVTDTAGSASTTIVLTGTGVAPSISGPSPSVVASNYVLVGQSSLLTLSVSNTGNGNLAGSGSANNLNGSFGSSSNSVFVGTGTATFSLTDNSKGTVLSTSSSTYAYTFKPTVTGAASTNVVTAFSNGTGTTNLGSSVTTTLAGIGVAPVQSVSNATIFGRFGSGSVSGGSITVTNVGNGNLAGTGTAYNLNGSVAALNSGAFSVSAASISLASNATGSTPGTTTSTLGYTYTPGSSRATTSTVATVAFSNGNSAGTNLAQSVAATITGSAVGPTYASSLSTTGSVGSFSLNTPTSHGSLGSVGAAGQTIAFGTVHYAASQTVYLELQNTSSDANGGNALLTDLTIEGFTITGANASAFRVSSIGSVLTENGGQVVVPITVVSSTYGLLNSSLTIFTDESVGYGGVRTGDTFTYALTAMNVPEPASLAILGAGLAGLASIRRRHRAAQ